MNNCYTLKYHNTIKFDLLTKVLCSSKFKLPKIEKLVISINTVNSGIVSKDMHEVSILSFFLCFFLTNRIDGAYKFNSLLKNGLLCEKFNYKLNLFSRDFFFFFDRLLFLNFDSYSEKINFNLYKKKLLYSNLPFLYTLDIKNKSNKFFEINSIFYRWFSPLRVSFCMYKKSTILLNYLVIQNIFR